MRRGVTEGDRVHGGNEERYVADCIGTGWISAAGPFGRRYEGEFAARVGRKHGVAVFDGTAAVDAAIAARGLGAGDEVILPTFTIISCASAILRAGAAPVVVDSDPETWNMRADQVEERITPRTKAIMVVHIYGLPVDMDPILALARDHGLKIIEDSAEMHGGAYRGKPCGGFGDISTFSFYPNKHVTTGEGGMALTDDDGLAQRLRLFRSHGVTRDPALMTHAAEGPWAYEQIDLGYNYRLTDMQAALGTAQVRRLDGFLARRREIAARYDELLADLGVVRPWQHPEGRSAYHLYPVLVPSRDGIDRAGVYAAMHAAGIRVNVHYIPVHLHPYYKQRFGYRGGEFPIAEAAYESFISLPMFHGMSDQDIEDVIAAVRKVATHFAK